MTSQPRAFFAVDFGSASTSAALLGHVGGRWRLIAHAAAPAHVDVDGMVTGLLSQIQLTDPAMLADLAGVDTPDIEVLATEWTRLEARTTPQRRIAVLAGSRRQRRRLEEAALRAGWLVAGGSSDDDDAMALSSLVLSTRTDAVLLGADRSPGGDERKNLPELVSLVAAARHLRPELTVVLAGGAAAYESTFVETEDATITTVSEAGAADPGPAVEAAAAEPTPPPTDTNAEAAALEEKAGQSKASPDVLTPPEPAELTGAFAAPAEAATAPPVSGVPLTQVLLAPDAEAGQPVGSSLQQVLEGLRAVPNDSRLGVVRSIASLAYVLDRRIEVVEVGLSGGLRARSEPIGQSHFAVMSSHACLAGGSFSPLEPSDEVIDSVFAWSTTAVDRHRLMDRLHDLRLVPWGEADGDGAVFRLAAAKAAVWRLVEATTEISASPMPELLVAAGGIFASLPPSVVALALADLLRRPGSVHLVCDQARLLGPLGAIEDESERRQLLANLADDILLPLGSLILPAGVKAGRTAGKMRLSGPDSISEIELHPGAVQVVDLPPGRSAKADISFKDTVRLGTRGHHFSLDVDGGLCGLLVDLRDIPLRMSDRPESRRAALDAWQRGMWPEADE